MQLIQDSRDACIHRAGQTARCPLYLPQDRLAPAQLDQLLASGWQRVGRTVFRTRCATCRACEPVRLPVADFRLSKSQRRLWRRNQDLAISVGEPGFSEERIALWMAHTEGRGLRHADDPLDATSYAHRLAVSCAPTVEIQMRLEGRLVALSLLDLGDTSANSAYCFYDPALARRSLGAFSILYELSLCRDFGLSWYYLGLWTADSPALRYKADWLPHERWIDGAWQRFEARQDWRPPPAREIPDDRPASSVIPLMRVGRGGWLGPG